MSSHRETPRPRLWILLGGVLGFAALLVQALLRLTPLALEPVRAGMTALQGAIYVGWVGFNAYAEGYRGFQCNVAPRVVARGRWLASHPKPLLVLVAPLMCMGLVYASRKRLIVSWSVLSGIVVLVSLVRLLGQPWRGIIDGGVVIGLGWGLTALAAYLVIGLSGRAIDVALDLPAGAAGAAGSDGAPTAVGAATRRP